MNWVELSFAVVTLAAALVATAAKNLKTAALALWIVGLGTGGIYLTFGAEAVAIIQWILSTLGAISLVFFAVMFGETAPPPVPAERRRGMVITLLGVGIGLAFSAAVYLGVGPLLEATIRIPEKGNDLAALGQVMTQNHLLSLEVLALTFFLLLVGGGVVARPEGPTENGLAPPLSTRDAEQGRAGTQAKASKSEEGVAL